MLRTLLESRPARRRRPGGIALSVLLHAGIIGVAATATAREVVRSDPARREQQILFVPQPMPEPASPRRVAVGTAEPASTATPLPELPQVVAPVTVPVGIPEVSDPLAAPITAATVGASEFRGGGTASIAQSIAAGARAEATPLTDAGEVLRLVGAAREPDYPDLLRQAGLEGRVTLRFQVDTAGRVDRRSVQALESTHALFTAAATRALLANPFVPATAGGRRVAALAEMTFTFQLRR